MNEPRMAWIAEDPASKAVVDLARKVAETSTTLLITGESGTGKDHLARLIHELGPRRDAPFLKIDCASLPQELVESELFGHERGAFTGAVERKLGRLEMAGAGTIVLDEVAALSPATQSKLLRVLEERQFERLGGTETITIAARLIALTNADLAHLVSDGQFREDLFFRLSVLTISVPALRARPADILPLADALLERAARVHGRDGVVFSEPVKKMLADYRWPGNVRELKKFDRARSGVLRRGLTLIPEDFPEPVRAADPAFGARCVRSKTSNATPFAPRSKPRATKSARARRFWASAARPCSTSARSTD
jgi:two-component system response regulator AtoC